MRSLFPGLLAVASLTVVCLGADVLFPYMRGLKYSEHDQAQKLGLTAHVCKDENEWNSMTTADFAQYKAIIVPDCLCNTSLNTIKFLDDTKRIWSPAVTGNMVIIGTDPSFHAKWYNLPGAYAMMQDAIKHVASGKDGTGMYFSLSCYYQSNSNPVAIEALSELGNFQVRGNLSHPCLNNAHLVATSNVMTSLNDEIASNWNCSVHEVFSEYPRTGNGSFQALAIALNATGPGQQSFADGTSGLPYIIARGATPLGCGDNVTEPDFHEECDDGALNGTPGSLCSPSCKCINGLASPGICRSNVTSTSSTPTLTPPTPTPTPIPTLNSTVTSTDSNMTTYSSSIQVNFTPSISFVTVTAPRRDTTWSHPVPFSNATGFANPTGPRGPITVTAYPPLPSNSTSRFSVSFGNRTLSSGPEESPLSPVTVTVGPTSDSGPPPESVTSAVSDPTPSIVTVTVEPPSLSELPPESVTPGVSDSTPPVLTLTVQPSEKPQSSQESLTAHPPFSGKFSTGAATGEPPRSSGAPSETESETPRGTVTVTASSQSDDSGRPRTTTWRSPLESGSSTSSGSSPPSYLSNATSQQSGLTSAGGPNISVVTVTAMTVTAEPSSQSASSFTSSQTRVSHADSPLVVTVTAGASDSTVPPSATSGATSGSGVSASPSASASALEVSSSPRSDSQPKTVTVPPLNQTGSVLPGQSGVPLATSSTTSPTIQSGQPESRSLGASLSATQSRNLSLTVSSPSQTSFPSSVSPGGPVVTSTATGEDRVSDALPLSGSATPPNGVVSSHWSVTLSGGTTLASGAISSERSVSGISSRADSSFSSSTAPVTASSGQSSSPLLTGPSGSSSSGTFDIPSPSPSSVSPGVASSDSGSASDVFTAVSSGNAFGTTSSAPPSSVLGNASGTLSVSPSAITSTSASNAAPSSSSLSSSGRVSSGYSVGPPPGATATRPTSYLTGVSSGLPNQTAGGVSSIFSDPYYVPPYAPPVISTQTARAGRPELGNYTWNRTATSMVGTAASPSPGKCGAWIGVEVIYLVEITEICPEGSTVTETVTECVATVTRSICQTSTSGHPCYPCILSSSVSSGHEVTVTRTSCSTINDSTLTVTIQPCSTCETSTYVGTVPGYTPGLPCHACSSYDAGASPTAAPSTKPSAYPSGASGGDSKTGDPINTDTAAIGTPVATATGNPDLPTGYPDGPVVAPSHTPYRPTSVPPLVPSVVTAGAMRGSVQLGAAWALTWVALML